MTSNQASGGLNREVVGKMTLEGPAVNRNFELMMLLLQSRAGHLKWIVVQILEVIVLMFETTGGLVRGHLVKNSCLTKLSKLLFFRGRFGHENSLESKK